jgi:hypothetical protein
VARQLSESNPRGLRGASPVWAGPRRGPPLAARSGLTGQTACARTPSRVSPLGSGFLVTAGPGPGSEGYSRRSAALGIRLPGGLSRATESSPRASLSVSTGWQGGKSWGRVSESVPAEAPRLPEQAWRDNQLAAEAVPLTRAVWTVPPGQWVPQSCRVV